MIESLAELGMVQESALMHDKLSFDRWVNPSNGIGCLVVRNGDEARIVRPIGPSGESWPDQLAELARTRSAEVIPFEQNVVTSLSLNSRDSVMTNAHKLASIGGGGTDCSAPLKRLNQRKAKGDLVVFVSDNESWVDARRGSTAVRKSG